MEADNNTIRSRPTKFLKKFLILEVALCLLLTLWYAINFCHTYQTNIKNKLVNAVEVVQMSVLDDFDTTQNLLIYVGKLILQIDTNHNRKTLSLIDTLYNHLKSKGLLALNPVMWSDKALNITIDSNFGVLDPPYQSATTFQFVPDVVTHPWQLLIGVPKIDNAIGMEVIPFALGITNQSKQYVGAIISAFEAEQIQQKFALIQKLYGNISLGIIDNQGKVIFHSKDANTPSNLEHIVDRYLLDTEKNEYFDINVCKWLNNSNSVYIKKVNKLNGCYIFAVFNESTFEGTFIDTVKETFFNLAIIITICIIIFLFTHKFIVSPIVELSKIANQLDDDVRDVEIKDYPTVELQLLAKGMKRIIAQKTELIATNEKLEFLLKQLEAMNKTKLDFIRNIQHELRTPLNHIIGGCEVMNSQFSGPIIPEYLEYIDIIYQSGRDLLNKINNIIAIADFEAGNVKLEEGECNLEQILNLSIQSLLPKIKQHKLELTVDIQQDLPLVYIDAEKMKTVLINLLHNSITFNKPLGHIFVSAIHSVAGILIEITDTGHGIKERDLSMITEMFATTGDVLTKVKSGLGLGLTIAQCILDLHDIKMEIYSKVNDGTTIKILIPNIRLIKPPSIKGAKEK